MSYLEFECLNGLLHPRHGQPSVREHVGEAQPSFHLPYLLFTTHFALLNE